MPDIPNPNVTIPLTIIIICGVIAWVTYGHHRRNQEQLRAEREERRNRNRPAEPRPAQYSVMPGSTQALPAVHPNGAAYGSASYGSAAYANTGYDNSTYSDPAYANGAYGDPAYANSAYAGAIHNQTAYGGVPYSDPGLGDPPHIGPPPAYSPPPAYDAPPAYSAPPAPVSAPGYSNSAYQLPPSAYDPPGVATPYETPASSFPSPEPWAPPSAAPPSRDISELAPTLPPSGAYSPPTENASPAQQYAEQYAADAPGSYLPSATELEDWNRQYAPAVEEWILNHEEALDAVTVRHVPVEALDRAFVARKVELTSHLDYAAHAHPSRQQGAELSEMIDSADGTLAAMQARDFGRAEQNHARYLSYRDIWLPRVQRALAP